ncbi:MAG: A24 family peptidase, partial [Thermoguttaceae bacterium]
HPRRISPWSRPEAVAPPRRPGDRLPIVGGLGVRREAALYGAGFWVRPMLVELLAGVGLAALYWWEVGRHGLLPALTPPADLAAHVVDMHCQFAAHALCMSLMLAAALIDFDEKTIPDAITIPGTLAGLLLAALMPVALLPDAFVDPAGGLFCQPLWLTAPNVWPAQLNGFPKAGPLWLGLACYLLWCLALLPRPWYARHGYRRALRILAAHVVRARATYGILAMALGGMAAVVAAWYWGGSHWAATLTALVGMAAGGGLIWAVRIVGSATLRREAMGFGDVTLLAMIGAFLGWQPCLIVFFLAPFAGLVLGVIHMMSGRGREIPYGPFLCLAAAATIVAWDPIWTSVAGVFSLGWLLPIVLLGCLVLMAALLLAWRLIAAAFHH